MEKETRQMSEIAKRDGIKIKGRKGTWYVVSEREYPNVTYYLVESEIYGDEAEWLLIDSDFNLVADGIYNGWDDVDYLIEIGEIDI